MNRTTTNTTCENNMLNQRMTLRDKVLFRLLKTKGKTVRDICDKLKYNTRNISILSADELCEIWCHTKTILVDAQKLCANKPVNDTVTKEYLMLMQLIRIITSMAIGTLSRKTFIPNVLLEVVIILHSVILPQTEDKKVKNEVSFFLENWWKMDMTWKEKVIVNAIKYLVECADLSPKILKRLIDVKSALYLTKGTDTSRAILELVQKNAIMSIDEGKELLSHLLALGEPWILEIHAYIKKLIESENRSQISLYADLYTTAWLIANPENKKLIKEKCMQDIIFHALRTQRISVDRNKHGKKLLVFLHALHKHPNKGVREMIHSVYKDTLWENIQAPGSTVRCNATDILFAAYPMMALSTNSNIISAYMNKQHCAVTNLLKDDNSYVCIAALRGISLLKGRMKCVPKNVMTDWLNVILKLSKESPSSEVRLCVHFALREIVSYVCDDSILQRFLPKFANSIYDENTCIAEAVIKLAQHVHQNTEMPFSKVIPLTYLLDYVITVKESALLQMLVELLLHDVVSLHVRKSEALDDLIYIGLTNLDAMKKLLLHSDHVMDWDSSLELIKDVLTTIKETFGSSGFTTVRRRSKRLKLCTDSRTKRTYVLFNIVATLLTMTKKNVQSSTDADKIESLLCDIAGELPQYYEKLQDLPAKETVMFLFSFVNPSSLSNMESLVHKFVEDLRQPNITRDSIMLILHVLNKWNTFNTVLEFLITVIELSLANMKDNLVSVKEYYDNLYVGFRTLKHLLASECQFGIINKHYERLLELWSALHTLRDIIEQKCGMEADSQQLKCNTLILDYFNEYIGMLSLLHKDDGFDALKEFSEILEWIERRILPCVPNEVEVKKDDFSCNVLQVVFRNSISSLKCLYVSPKLCYDIALLLIKCIQLPCGIIFMSYSFTIMVALLCNAKLSHASTDCKLMKFVIPNLLSAQMIRLITYPEEVIVNHAFVLKKLSLMIEKFYEVTESCLKGPDRHDWYMTIILNSVVSGISKNSNNKATPSKAKNILKCKVPHIVHQLLKILLSQKKYQVVIVQILQATMAKYSNLDMLSALLVVNKLIQIGNKIPKDDIQAIVSIADAQCQKESKEYVDVAMKVMIKAMSQYQVIASDDKSDIYVGYRANKVPHKRFIKGE